MPLCNGNMVYKSRPIDYAVEVKKDGTGTKTGGSAEGPGDVSG